MPRKPEKLPSSEEGVRWEPVRQEENHSNPKPDPQKFSQPKEPVKRTKGDEPSTCGCDL